MQKKRKYDNNGAKRTKHILARLSEDVLGYVTRISHDGIKDVVLKQLRHQTRGLCIRLDLPRDAWRNHLERLNLFIIKAIHWPTDDYYMLRWTLQIKADPRTFRFGTMEPDAVIVPLISTMV